MCDDKRSDAFAWSGERFACAEGMGEKSSRFSWEIMKQHLIIIHLNYDNEWLENIIALWQYRILGKTGEWMAKTTPLPDHSTADGMVKAFREMQLISISCFIFWINWIELNSKCCVLENIEKKIRWNQGYICLYMYPEHCISFYLMPWQRNGRRKKSEQDWNKKLNVLELISFIEKCCSGGGNLRVVSCHSAEILYTIESRSDGQNGR